MTTPDEAAFVAGYLTESRSALDRFAADPAAQAAMAGMARAVCASLRAGGKLLVAGNGGSAADAQHIAGEIVGRLMYDRPPLACIALTTDSSVLTAIANDYGYSAVFERQVRALGRPGDVFLGISTSGRSGGVLAALDAARQGGLATLGFCGEHTAAMAPRCDLVLAAPSPRTAIVQQVHIVAAHIVCALIERAMFPPSA